MCKNTYSKLKPLFKSHRSTFLITPTPMKIPLAKDVKNTNGDDSIHLKSDFCGNVSQKKSKNLGKIE